MFGLQPTHVLLILIAALIFFAPQRLPALVRNMGKAVQEFRQAIRRDDPAVDKSRTPSPPDESSS